MAENKIQIVINPRDYIGEKDPITGFGPNIDFFRGEDDAFVAHKSVLSHELAAVEVASRQNPYSQITYAKVKMRSNAIAKTHRPTKSIFSVNKRSFVVGGAGVGELLIEMRPGSISKVKNAIVSAEDQSRVKPSRSRSEVGGIQTIAPYSPIDRVPFSLAELISWKGDGIISNGYYVELFHPLSSLNNRQQLSEDLKGLLTSFKDKLDSFEYLSHKELLTSGGGGLLFVHIESNNEDYYKEISAQLIDFLSSHPLVRKVTPAPSLSSFSTSTGTGLDVDLTAPDDLSGFPIVGVIDNGISDVFNGWRIYRSDELPDSFRVEDHGSKIAGLLVKGNELNGSVVVPETDGCRLVDLFLLPSEGRIADVYSAGIEQFFETLRNAVEAAKEQTGARIYNLSMNQKSRTSCEASYSIAAKKLDEIADELDVLFVISAGNLCLNELRDDWVPSDPDHNIEGILPEQIALPPAESMRGISVMALDPNDLSPTSYTRVGPAYKAGVKPDVSYVGGTDANSLATVNLDGQKSLTIGTSMSAPLVAKILASLDKKIEGDVSLEILKALLIHHTTYPDVIKDEEYKEIRKNLYGFGVPASSEEILTEDAHSFTFVVADNISSDKKLCVPFPWPNCLKNSDGTGRGNVKLTLVSRPALDSSFGEEFVRENVTAYLRTITSDGTKKGLLSFEFSEIGEDEPLDEVNLIKDSFKWNPIKVSHVQLKRKKIVGDVYLEIEYLAREGIESNYDGVPFAAILTFSDPKGEAQVNTEMKAQMSALGIQLSDIQIAAQIRGRL